MPRERACSILQNHVYPLSLPEANGDWSADCVKALISVVDGSKCYNRIRVKRLCGAGCSVEGKRPQVVLRQGDDMRFMFIQL